LPVAVAVAPNVTCAAWGTLDESVVASDAVDPAESFGQFPAAGGFFDDGEKSWTFCVFVMASVLEREPREYVALAVKGN
jgi:hypothetical protein